MPQQIPTIKLSIASINVAIVVLLLSIGYSLAAETLRLQPGVPVVVSQSEPAPVRRAAEDLCRDLQWVLKSPSPLLEEAPKEPGAVAIVITSQALNQSSPSIPKLSGNETHAIFVRGQQVMLQGADMRGAIYAIYSFSERFLDVPPWWFWADWKPQTRAVIEVPADTSLLWNAPQVKWRAWFPNDTDLLSPWIQKDYANRWNLVLETMLRLKLNMIDIGEYSDDTMRKVRLPRDRGLATTTTHLAPFGASLKHWADYWKAQGQVPPPPLTLANVRELEQFWEHHIRLAQQEKLEMLWTIGFRGDADKGFYKTFPDAPADDAGRGKVVETMLKRQVALLKQVTGQEHPPMRTVIYDECSDYIAAGLMQPPEEPSLILNFAAARHDHFPAADVRQYHAPEGRKLGYYFNVQFTNTGSHLADGEGPWKMEKNHRVVLESGPELELSIVNSGNTREFPLTLEAHARMMWDFNAYESTRFVGEFCQRYWGPEHGPRVATLYRDFFDAYWQQRKPDLPDFPRQYIFHDLRIARATRDMMRAASTEVPTEMLLDDRGTGYYRIVPADSGAVSKPDAVISGSRVAADKFADVAARCTELSPQLNAQGRGFFDQGLRMQAAFMAAASRCLVDSAEAYKAMQDKPLHDQWMRRAQEDSNAMSEALSTAAKGSFQQWYDGEKIFGLKETREMIDRRVRGEIKPMR